MTKDGALKLALVALGEIEWSNNSQWQSDRAKVAITAIKEALAQQDAEYERGFVDGAQHQMKSSVDKAVNGFYKKREWVGLTTDERDHFTYIDAKDKARFRKHSDYIEATLKEKNQ